MTITKAAAWKNKGWAHTSLFSYRYQPSHFEFHFKFGKSVPEMCAVVLLYTRTSVGRVIIILFNPLIEPCASIVDGWTDVINRHYFFPRCPWVSE